MILKVKLRKERRDTANACFLRAEELPADFQPTVTGKQNKMQLGEGAKSKKEREREKEWLRSRMAGPSNMEASQATVAR